MICVYNYGKPKIRHFEKKMSVKSPKIRTITGLYWTVSGDCDMIKCPHFLDKKE